MMAIVAAVLPAPGQSESSSPDSPPPPAGKVDVTKLELQVEALSAVHELELTPAQLTILRTYNSAAPTDDSDAEAAAVLPPAPRFAADTYRAALKNLQSALLDSHATHLAEAQSKLEQLRDAQKIEPAPAVELTALARKQASSMLLTLSTGQVAGYIAQHADEIPDATQTLLDALDQSRQSTHTDYPKLRDTAADQAAVLLSGVDATRFQSMRQRIVTWLDRAHAMDDDEYASKEPELEGDLRRMVGRMDPTLELRYWMLHQVGELLSNPQLSVALNLLRTE